MYIRVQGQAFELLGCNNSSQAQKLEAEQIVFKNNELLIRQYRESPQSDTTKLKQKDLTSSFQHGQAHQINRANLKWHHFQPEARALRICNAQIQQTRE